MAGGNTVVSRRSFVARLAGGAVAACAVGVERAHALTGRDAGQLTPSSGNGSEALAAGEPATGRRPGESLSQVQPAPWSLLSPLAQGAAVAHGWHVAGLTEVVDGSCALTLANQRGRELRLHLCRNDGRPRGLAYTNRLDLMVMNGGLGDLPTEETFAQAVAEVAHVLAANEGRSEHEAVLSALLSHAERSERFGAAAQLR
jgi:hypothetical protein